MPLVTGLNHVAVVTADLDALTTFYQHVFELELVFEEATPAFRHAMLLVAPGAVIHAIELPGSPHAVGRPAMMDRGHLDHVALAVADADAFAAVVERLVASGASSGEIEDLGAKHSTWFVDPDGMHGEVELVLDERMNGVHAPRPLLVDVTSST